MKKSVNVPFEQPDKGAGGDCNINHILQSCGTLAGNIREDALLMAFCAGAGAAHLGGGLSHIDILSVLYGAVMKHNSDNPEWDERDRFILSKGHGVLGYYGALCETGYIPREELFGFEKSGSDLLGHPVKNLKKGIEATTGSLGQGLSLGIGMALGLKEQGKSSKVYVLLGDGECNEGSVWEAFMSASQYKMDNITAIIDRNHFQLGGDTKDVMDVGNISDKIRAFGWEVREVDGHNIKEVYEALKKPREEDKPLAIVADTVKGYGFSFCEGNNAYHHAVVTKDLYETGMRELGKECDPDSIRKKAEEWKENHSAYLKKYKSHIKKSQIENKITVTKQLARRWSMVGQRAAFGLAVMEIAPDNPKLKVLTADVSSSAGLERLKKTYPDKFLDAGIAEQNMMGIASGYSQTGYDVITATFAPFQSMRCLEQIRVNMGYMGSKVIMVGLAGGLVLGTLGNTHCCFEDIGVLRSIPNIAVISPADSCEVGKALEAALKTDMSVYIRLLGGSGCPVIYTEDYNFEIGKAVIIKGDLEKENNDVVLIASGTMVNESVKAFELLAEKGISSVVVNMHTIKPIDKDTILKAVGNSKVIVTVEEHNKYGGLSTAVSEVLVENGGFSKFISIGLPDEYGCGGDYKDLLELYGLTGGSIADKVIENL